jgi:uncharacterized protein
MSPPLFERGSFLGRKLYGTYLRPTSALVVALVALKSRRRERLYSYSYGSLVSVGAGKSTPSLSSASGTSKASLWYHLDMKRSKIINKLSDHDGPKLDSDTERAAHSFMQRLRERRLVREVILFGSRARGTHRPDSDADIAVVLQGEHGNRTAAALEMAGIAFDVMMDTGILVEALPLWADDLEFPGPFRNRRLLERIRREGVRL